MSFRRSLLSAVAGVSVLIALGSIWISLIGQPGEDLLLSLLLLCAVIAFYYRSRQKTIYQDLFLKEKELRESHEVFRTILYSIGDGVITTDLAGRVRQMNHSAAALTGWDETDAEGRHLDEVLTLIDESTRVKIESPYAKILREGKASALTNHTLLVSKNGREIPIADSGAPITDDHGQTGGMVLVICDKTDAHRVEKELRETNDRLHRAEEVAMTGNWNLTLGDNAMHISDGAMAIYGFTHNDPLLAQIRAASLPEYRDALEEAMKSTIVNGAPYDMEFRIRNRADNSVKWIHSRAALDPASKTVFGVIQDVTHRKATEDTLRKLSRSVEQSPATIIIADLEGNIEYVNPKFTEVTGYTSLEVIGKNPRFLKSGEMPLEEYQRLWSTITSGREWRGEFHNRKKNGELFWESASISPITDEQGTNVHYLALKEDITERKALEEQLIQAQKMEGVGALAGGIAHDFNNLLAMILGSAELLRQHANENPELSKYVDRIIEASERGSSISRQLLIFSRPNQMELQPVSLPHMVGELREMLRHFLPKSINVHTELTAEYGIILGDSGQIHQALLNLALNARDAMPEGGTLTIREFMSDPEWISDKFGVSAAETPFVSISLSDTGMGIDPSIAGRIFEPFFSTKERTKGTGLGLSIVHGIVKNHKGFIDIDSAPGRGATFTILFPLHSDQELDPVEADRNAPVTGHGTILLVDDEATLREMLCEYLIDCGYSVHMASNGFEALEKFTGCGEAFDLVITDLGMPDMGGEELYGHLKRLDPNVKVIVSSGYLDGSTKGYLEEMGINGVLKKPYRLNSITDEIDRILNTDATPALFV